MKHECIDRDGAAKPTVNLVRDVGGHGGAQNHDVTVTCALQEPLHGVRVVIPASLRSFAGLAGEAVVVGSRDHAEIWAPATWETYSRELESPEALAAHLSGLGI